MTSRPRTAPLRGTVRVPGDKSVTQRALLLGAVAQGDTVVRGALRALDTLATAAVVARLGARLDWGEALLTIRGVEQPASPAEPLDCANAGTAARLLLGLLAGRSGKWVLDGDASLRRRPMGRVVTPLCAAGASITGERLPLTITGAPLRGGRHEVAIPSAQVKSALLLSGLAADGPTTVVQYVPTRDHTERMLPRFGIRMETEPGQTTVWPGRPAAIELEVPGDPSSAAFVLVAALLTPGSAVRVEGVGLWPRRTGFLRALERAGAQVMVMTRSPTDSTHDPVGDLQATSGPLQAFEIEPGDVPDLVDEIPVLALAAARARGTSYFRGLAELRLKESDRVATVAALLSSLGVPVRTGPDSLQITGVEQLHLPDSPPDLSDHRLALTWHVACTSLGVEAPLPPSASVSFGEFADTIRELREGG